MANSFSDPEESSDEWIDVRMTDPDVGEWDVDAVVIEGRVEYLDLRIDPELLAGFVTCLLDDMDDEQAASTLAAVLDRRGLSAADVPDDSA